MLTQLVSRMPLMRNLLRSWYHRPRDQITQQLELPGAGVITIELAIDLAVFPTALGRAQTFDRALHEIAESDQRREQSEHGGDAQQVGAPL